MADSPPGAQHRSILFAPPQRQDWIAGAAAAGADAVMLDLEDMVPVARKAAARAAVAEAVTELAATPVARFVRINGWHSGHVIRDLTSVVVDGLTGIGLPKAETAEDVHALDRLLGDLELERGLPPGEIEIIPLTETARGIHNSHALASASPRVKRFYGVMNATREGDAAHSLRLQLDRDGTEWTAIGSFVLLAARAAGIAHILGATAMEPADLGRCRSLAERSRTFGANGALCIHPDQIPVLNEVYSPSPDDVEHACTILREVGAALERGESTAVVDGELATYSHVRMAYDTIADARRFGLPVGDVPTIELVAIAGA